MIPLLLTLLACHSEPVPEPQEPSQPLQLPEGQVDDLGDALAPEGQQGRDRHRMSIAQLADSVERTTGLRWMDGNKDVFEDLSPTLGVPDWNETTAENRTPDLVFQKILGDAAAEVCLDLVTAESSGGERLMVNINLGSTLDNDAVAIEAALSAALLRFHGQRVPVGSEILGPWLWLFESTTNVTQGDTAVAWQAVCTALIIHPDFYTY
ncbi:MAG: hypothetical protein GWP91_06745 [Rhodobacterales bacterium]|nr:hypothetical protein [Rhodobacterales bacterium]